MPDLELDPIAAMEEELETIRQRLTMDFDSKLEEFERFKEENLWRLNAVSDRTLEMAALEEDEVDMFLAQDEKKWSERAEEQKKILELELMDECFLGGLASSFFARLLPSTSASTSIAEGGAYVT